MTVRPGTGRRLASIDVGTNTVRLLAVEAGSDSISILDDFGEVTRLGGAIAATGRIGQADADRTFAVLSHCLERVRAAGIDEVDIAGTEVFRAAANGAEVVRDFSDRLGHEVRVLTPADEAEASYLGVVGWAGEMPPEALLAFDVGGGSTELIAGEGAVLRRSTSVPIGALVITERHLLHDPATKEEIRGARQHISKSLQEIHGMLGHGDHARQVVGVGGTVCALGAWIHGVIPFDPWKVHGREISPETLAGAVNDWSHMNLQERMRAGGLSEGRARVVLGGALIVEGVLGLLGVTRARVSVHGLRHGLVLRRLLLA